MGEAIPIAADEVRALEMLVQEPARRADEAASCLMRNLAARGLVTRRGRAFVVSQRGWQEIRRLRARP